MSTPLRWRAGRQAIRISWCHSSTLQTQSSTARCISRVSRSQTTSPLSRQILHTPRNHSTLPNHNNAAPSPTSTIDNSEISHFNALASSWWDPHGPSRLLHLMNPLRQTFIQQCLSSQSTPQPPNHKYNYLDIGCGGGIFAESAARLPSTNSVTAIDPSPEVLKIATAHQKRDPLLTRPGKLTYLNHGIEDLPTSPHGGYDVVTIFEVVEHVSNPSSFLTTVLPHVKPGGWLIMSTIARTWMSWMITNVIAEDVLGIVPRGTHDWKKYINEEELRGWFTKREGWGSPRAMGVMYVPGIGWREVPGGENVGNYFFGVRRNE
jgi:polyprenyldihydroxybenzoate methyltransferase/3-demethylubiquinol 3-O-methyltransferase